MLEKAAYLTLMDRFHEILDFYILRLCIIQKLKSYPKNISTRIITFIAFNRTLLLLSESFFYALFKSCDDIKQLWSGMEISKAMLTYIWGPI